MSFMFPCYRSRPGEKICANYESEDFNYYYFEVVNYIFEGNGCTVVYNLEYYRNGTEYNNISCKVNTDTRDVKILRPQLFDTWRNVATYINIHNKIPITDNYVGGNSYSIEGKDECCENINLCEQYDYIYMRSHVDQIIYFYYKPGKSMTIEISDHEFLENLIIEYEGNVDKRMFEDLTKMIVSIPRHISYPCQDRFFVRKEDFTNYLSSINSANR